MLFPPTQGWRHSPGPPALAQHLSWDGGGCGRSREGFGRLKVPDGIWGRGLRWGSFHQRGLIGAGAGGVLAPSGTHVCCLGTYAGVEPAGTSPSSFPGTRCRWPAGAGTAVQGATGARCAGGSAEGVAERGCPLPWLPLLCEPVASCEAAARGGKWLLGERMGRLKFDASSEAISDQAQR